MTFFNINIGVSMVIKIEHVCWKIEIGFPWMALTSFTIKHKKTKSFQCHLFANDVLNFSF